MKNIMFLSKLMISLLLCGLLGTASAQSAPAQQVRGENYQISNQENGLEILWDGIPATSDQLLKDDQQIKVLDPVTGKARLLILLAEDGTFTDVIDLEYTSLETYLARQARDRAYAERDRQRAQRDRARAVRDAARQRRDRQRDRARAKRDAAYETRDAARLQRDRAHAVRDAARQRRDRQRNRARAKRDTAFQRREAARQERNQARRGNHQNR
ncbi:MAG: hypothetical protein AAF433_03140 [Bacteroidota bacterium]